MPYDWSGARARRSRIMRLTTALCVVLLFVSVSLFMHL